MPAISVIIPVYNVEKYLRECLDSVVKQTLNDIEIICVNDGSTDNSLEILNEYAKQDNRIKIINKENGGASSSRNVGLEVATAKWISFVDSDDWLEENTYEKIIKILNENSDKNIDIVCFGTQMQGTATLKQTKSDNKYYKIKYKGLKLLSDDVRFNINVAPSNKIYKKVLLINII